MNLWDNILNPLFDFFKRNDWYGQNTFLLGQTGAIWLDVHKPYELYNTVPQLKLVVDRRASMYANANIKLRKKKSDGTYEELTDLDFSKLMNNPNPMQSCTDFLRNTKSQKLIYGNQFIYKSKASKSQRFPTLLYPISPRYMQPILTGKVFDQFRISDIISGYQSETNGAIIKYKTEDIIWSKENDLDNPLVGKSPVYSLKFPLSNTKLSYEFRNVIMSEKGALGLLTSEVSKDSGGGSVQMTKKQKDELYKEHVETYGIQEGKRKIILSEHALKWQAMTFPTKDMLLFEEVDANFMTIIDHYGLNANIFSSKNATYENVQQGLKMSYQDTIIPDANQDAQRWTQEFGLDKLGIEIYFDYSHISILSEDQESEGRTFASYMTAINQSVTSGLVSAQQGLSMMKSLFPLIDIGKIKD